ncbi:unnamed protein product [Schistosoma margrebowiei]|uniref:Uncharacterized protein n=1 Tax=Schistosoma margrebowiei TaxID=48269 RepID=A0A183M5Z4_9TREM|nr:unnamed protein product [Schistosoma margrebowiei]
MKRYNQEVLGISETHWMQVEQQPLASENLLLHSGHEEENTPHTLNEKTTMENKWKGMKETITPTTTRNESLLIHRTRFKKGGTTKQQSIPAKQEQRKPRHMLSTQK